MFISLGIPGIIGAIDGCHIAIKAPPHNAIDYYNRNNYHSIILQGVCDDKKAFINIFVGSPGRVHDARVFRTSQLYEQLNQHVPPLSPTQHLIGDAAYPLLPFLMKPYRDNGHLNNRQIRFNSTLSTARVVIEQAFGLLKTKFRRLKYIDMGRVDMIPTVVSAACVLHNIILQYDGFLLQEVDANEAQELQAEIEVDEEHRHVYNVAETKRNYLASLLV